jgi:hypothetical protein
MDTGSRTGGRRRGSDADVCFSALRMSRSGLLVPTSLRRHRANRCVGYRARERLVLTAAHDAGRGTSGALFCAIRSLSLRGISWGQFPALIRGEAVTPSSSNASAAR